MMNYDINNFEAGKNYVIEASAGTGKTYSIVEMVGKLLDSGISLDEILLVTYTEKAAGELKNRIRQSMTENGRKGDVDGASIGTIHSFCQHIIEEFCIASGKQSAITLIDESDSEDFVRQYIRSDGVFDEIVEIKKKYLEKARMSSKTDDFKKAAVEESIVRKMAALLDKYYLNEDGTENEKIAVLDPFIEQYFIEKRDIKDIVPELRDDIKTIRTNKRLSVICDDLINSRDLSPVDSKNKGKNDSPEVEEALKRIKGIRKRIKELSEDVVALFIVSHTPDLYLKWQQEKEKKNVQTFNDMLRNVREAVVKKDSTLCEKIREKYKYAIIDEFQDTNQKQWDIFKEVFLCENHNIIVVGDPKQSIYSFQGADIDVYKSAVNEIVRSGGEKFVLATNYRSSKKQVETANKFFENEDAIEGFTPSNAKRNYSVEYDGKDVEAYWIATENDENTDPERHIDPVKYGKVVAQTIADCCSFDKDGKTKLRLIDEDGSARNVKFSDFAVLAKTRKEMEPVMSALEETGIPYVKYKNDTLFTGKECAEWIAVLEAVNTVDFSGKNRSKFRKALYTRFFGFNLFETTSPEFDKDNIPETGLFERWREYAGENRWEDLIDHIISDTDIEAKMSGLNDLKTLGVIRQLADYCIDYLSESNSIEMLVRNLRKQMNKSNDEEDDENSSIIARSTDFDCVRIMTIHASKGLEFPIVISVAGWKGLKPGEEIYSYHDSGNPVLSLKKDREKCNAEAKAEWQRIFYVAYTRAKYILMLPWYKPLGSVMDFISDSIKTFMENYPNDYRSIEDNGKETDEIKDTVQDILDHYRKNSTSSVTEEDQKKALKEIIKNEFWHSSYKHAYSSLSYDKSQAKESEETTISETGINVNNGETKADSGLEKYDLEAKQILCKYDIGAEPEKLSENFPAGAELGNALHDIFELIDYENISYDAETDKLIRSCYKNQGMRFKDEWLDDTKKMIENVLHGVMPVIHGSEEIEDESLKLCEIGFKDRKNEIEFNFNKENAFLRHYFNGFIDLIFRRGEYYSILDWKSDRLNDEFTAYNDPDTVKERVDKHYSIQRVLYSYTLIKWLKNFYPDDSEQEIFEKHFGGVYYVFLRGCNSNTGNGIYAQTWENYDTLKEAYEKIVNDKVRG